TSSQASPERTYSGWTAARSRRDSASRMALSRPPLTRTAREASEWFIPVILGRATAATGTRPEFPCPAAGERVKRERKLGGPLNLAAAKRSPYVSLRPPVGRHHSTGPVNRRDLKRPGPNDDEEENPPTKARAGPKAALAPSHFPAAAEGGC